MWQRSQASCETPSLLTSLALLLSALAVSAYGQTPTEMPTVAQMPPPVVEQVLFEEAAKPLSGRLLSSVKGKSGEQILVIDLDRKVSTLVAQEKSTNLQPRWSPDGTEIVYVAERDGLRRIVRADWDGTNQTVLLPAEAAAQEGVDWGPDSKGITFIKGGHTVVSYLLDTKAQSSLMAQPTHRLFSQRLSPDGRQLAYSSDTNWPGSDLCVFSIAKGSGRCPLAGAARYGRPAWNPDGKRLAYMVEHDDESEVGVIELESARVSQISGRDGRDREPCWSPDGSKLLFASTSTETESSKIWISDLSAEPQLVLTMPSMIRSLQWSKAKTIEVEALRVKRMGGATR